MTKSYLKFSLRGYKKYKWYSLILAQILHTCSFVESALRTLSSQYFEFFRISGKLWGTGSEHRFFRLCAIIVTDHSVLYF